MADTTKLRLLYIYKLLNEETDADHYLTINQLRKELLDRWGIESHRQTVSSDIEALRTLGVDISEYLGTQKHFWIEKRMFTVPEVKLLMDAVSAAKFIPKIKSTELESKLVTLVSNYEAEGLVRNVSVEHRVKRDNEQIYQIIDVVNDAINQGRKISFLYFKYDVKKHQQLRNDGEPYVFSPHQLVWNGDFYYAVGVNDERLVRIFRLDRMFGVPKILEEKAKGFPRGFSMSKFLNTTFRMFGTDYRTVTLLCDKDVIDSILDRFGKGIRVKSIGNNQFQITVDVAVSNVFYSWVFGFEGKVRIEKPEDVKADYRSMVEMALAHS